MIGLAANNCRKIGIILYTASKNQWYVPLKHSVKDRQTFASIFKKTKHGHLISISVGLDMKYEEIYTVEFKQEVNADFKKEIIAFANSEGGVFYRCRQERRRYRRDER